MNNSCGAANPDIDKATHLLRVQESKTAHKYSLSQKSTAHLPQQKEEDKVRDIKFKQARELYHKKVLPLPAYHELICNIHSFVPKKKYLGQATDTDSDTSDEDINDRGLDDDEINAAMAYIFQDNEEVDEIPFRVLQIAQPERPAAAATAIVPNERTHQCTYIDRQTSLRCPKMCLKNGLKNHMNRCPFKN
jgi:hypothetical protein